MFVVDKATRSMLKFICSLQIRFLIGIRASSYELGNWAGSVTYREEFCFLGYFSLGYFSPVCWDEMMEHKLVPFAAVFLALWTLLTLLIKLVCILLKWKYTQDKKYTILAAMLRKAVLSKKFRPDYPGWSVHMKTFSSRLPRSPSQKPRSR